MVGAGQVILAQSHERGSSLEHWLASHVSTVAALAMVVSTQTCPAVHVVMPHWIGGGGIQLTGPTFHIAPVPPAQTAWVCIIVLVEHVPMGQVTAPKQLQSSPVFSTMLASGHEPIVAHSAFSNMPHVPPVHEIVDLKQH
jgi:hypothetical protein